MRIMLIASMIAENIPIKLNPSIPPPVIVLVLASLLKSESDVVDSSVEPLVLVLGPSDGGVSDETRKNMDV